MRNTSLNQAPDIQSTDQVPASQTGAPIATTGNPRPINPVAHDREVDALKKIQSNDPTGALADVKAGLAADPEDPQLKILDKLLTKRIQNPIDSRALDRQIQALVDQRSDDMPGAPDSPSRVSGTLTAMHLHGLTSVIGSPITEFKPPPRDGPLAPAYVRIRMKDYSGAENYLNQKIHENPLDWQAYRLRALARFKQNNFSGAILDAEGALNINRRDIWILNTLALSLAKLNRLQESLEAFKESLSLNPRNGATYFSRSEAWKQAGNEEERLSDLEEASKYDEQFKSIYEDALNDYRKKGHLSHGLPAGRWPWALGLVAVAGLLALGYAYRGRMALPTPIDLEPEAAQAPLALGPGARLGDFEIIRPLGQGGMGVVYEASDLLLGRAVAVKKLREEIAGDAKERQRFLKEARIVAALDHPHIVRIHSVLDRPEGIFLIFEFIAGETLDRALGQQKKLPMADALRHLKTVAHALDYAHRRGIIHRDLKPSNIMLTRDGVAKVMDFGIAWKAQETFSRLTHKNGTVVGTPMYVAPEQSWGECVRESDVYALAVCSYEMLSGRMPFDGPNLQQLKMDKMFTPLSRVLHRSPKGLDAVFERALDPIHSKRHHSAVEFVEALEAALPAESKA